MNFNKTNYLEKRYFNRSQGSNKCVDDGDKLLRRLTGGDPMDISERICVSKSNDVCCLSSAPVTNKPCDMQTWQVKPDIV